MPMHGMECCEFEETGACDLAQRPWSIERKARWVQSGAASMRRESKEHGILSRPSQTLYILFHVYR
jgi:hypothetical protein